MKKKDGYCRPFSYFHRLVILAMTRHLTYFIFLLSCLTLQAQQFEEVAGTVENIAGIKRYNVVFEYSSNLKIPKNDSEEDFLQKQYEKRELKKSGAGESFKKLWFENRINLYEPTFIQQFNSFSLDDRQVTVAKNISSTAYTMKIETVSIAGGYDDFFYVEEGEIGVLISIYETDSPENILYALKTDVRGVANADDFERIRTAYGNLGEAASKHFSRKILSKK